MSAGVEDEFVRTWRDVGDDLVFLTLEADGSFIGFDGCNGLFGQWSIDGNDADLGAMGTTQRGCDMDVWLSTGRTVQIEDGGIRVLDATGALIGHMVAEG